MIKIQTSPFTNDVKHICEQLYKIKKINRNKDYTISELQHIIFNHKVGKKVINELKERKICPAYLKFWGQKLLADIFSIKL